MNTCNRLLRIVPLASAVFLLTACSTSASDTSEPVTGSDLEGTVFVANKRGDSLSMIDLASGTEAKRVESCTNPHELAVSPDKSTIALACYGGTSVDLFAADTLAKLKRIDLGTNARPHGIVWHPNGDLYATAEGRQSIFWIKAPLSEAPETFEYATGKLGSHMIAVSPDANHAWTTDLGSKTVTRIDLKTRRAPLSVTVGEEPEGIALSPDGTALWVSARGSNKAYELDPQSLEVRRTVATGQFPLRLAIRPQGDVAVTSDLADGALSVIDLESASISRAITVSGDQEALQVTIVWSEDGERIYAAETGSDTIAEVDFESGEVLRRLPTGEGGDGLAVLER